MPKDSYDSKLPDADGRYSYTADEDAVWGELFTRQARALRGVAAPQFLAGLDRLGLTPDHVPQVRDLDASLAKLSDAGVEGVPAIIPPSQFFALLAQRHFPVATFLRRREDMDYIEEPDLFHEVFGHCPMMTDRTFVDFVEAFGKTAQALPRGSNWHMFRLFWFTVEFGLIETPEGLRAYGAGIASSPVEAAHALGGTPVLRPFDLREMLRTPYRIDIVQPLYFVIDDFATLARSLEADVAALIAEAKELGDLPPLFAPDAA